jgi:hypothetical protein
MSLFVFKRILDFYCGSVGELTEVIAKKKIFSDKLLEWYKKPGFNSSNV